MEGITKIVKSLEDSGRKQFKMKLNEQIEGFLSMSLVTLGASLLGNILAGKRINRAGYENKKRKGVIRAGYGSKLYF